MKLILTTLFIISSTFLLAQTSEQLIGSWKLHKEKKLYKEEKNLPSIMSVPEDEESTSEPQPRTAELHFLKGNTLRSVDGGSEQTTTFQLEGNNLTLGNREYLLKRLTKSKLIFIEEGLFGNTKIIFRRMYTRSSTKDKKT